MWGKPETSQGEVNLPLRCDWPNRPRQMVDHELGKPSLTHYSLIDNHRPEHGRVSLKPVTGRSHQLRVHMAELGHPIIGCEFYAHPEAKAASERLHLHACQLSFSHPESGESLSFASPAPF